MLTPLGTTYVNVPAPVKAVVRPQVLVSVLHEQVSSGVAVSTHVPSFAHAPQLPSPHSTALAPAQRHPHRKQCMC